MSALSDLEGLANLVSVVDNNIRPEQILEFIKTHIHLSQQEPLEIDPSDGEWLFLPVLQKIIDNPDTPTSVRITADKMYQSEYARNW